MSPIIPGEDPQEFKELHLALIDEWKPSGPTEEDAVFDLADFMWRKRRAQKFLQAKLIANDLDPRHPAFDENRGLHMFICFMYFEPETAFEKRANICLRADKIAHLKQKFPRSSYGSTAEWAEAIIKEIRAVLLPATPSFELEPGEKPDPWTEAFRKVTIDLRLFVSIIHASEFFERDLDQHERLAANIARIIKSLVYTKTMKQMLSQTSTGREDEEPRKIASKAHSKDHD